MFPFARGRFASAEAAHLQCSKDFLSPLPPNCIYAEEGRQWVLKSRSPLPEGLQLRNSNDDLHI